MNHRAWTRCEACKPKGSKDEHEAHLLHRSSHPCSHLELLYRRFRAPRPPSITEFFHPRACLPKF
jgi:hypothetical protein